MAGTTYQGALISSVKSGFDDTLNADPDMDGMGYFIGWRQPLIDIEPEMFRSKGTTTASITFKEVKTETNAEVIQIQILYEIYTSS